MYRAVLFDIGWHTMQENCSCILKYPGFRVPYLCHYVKQYFNTMQRNSGLWLEALFLIPQHCCSIVYYQLILLQQAS